jgi:glycogen debranching enzyme
MMKRLFFLSILCALLSAAQTIDELGITVKGPGRQFVYTNKEAGTYYGEVNGINTGGWQGWFVNAEKIMHEYAIRIGGTEVDRSTATTLVLPHQIHRTYAHNVIETMTLADSLDLVLITVNDPAAELEIRPVDYFRQDGAVWNRMNAAADFAVTAIAVAAERTADAVTFAIAGDRSVDRARRIAAYGAAHAHTLIAQKKQRIRRILDRSYTTVNNERLTRALGWAKIQIDALIMNQATSGVRTKGIFAGLPWFNNYWGRDSFIALPGATYVTGNFNDAREVLLSYAAFQEKDSASSHYGRIPNLATPQSVIYNTADGTPWFVKALYEYVKYSGDTALVRDIYPVLVRSIEGTIRHHTDSLGFLTHGDAESWMDAVGPNGPWSPRGDRAVDIQALWHQQLMVGVFCAEYLFDYAHASQWKNLADRLERNFRTYFVDTTRQLLYDHRNSDGTPSVELRPNQLFAFDMAIPEDVRQQMVRTVLGELTYEHGTATLTQSDSNFYPYHEHPPFYVKDAAYHNGIIWTWLNGPMIYAATRYDLQDLVYSVTQNSVHQMLERGCVGALSELLNAHTKPGETEPRLSGTFSQAWCLSEFIRSFYQDYLGISIDLPSRSLRINPKLPKELTRFEMIQRLGSGAVSIRHSVSRDTVTTIVEPSALAHGMTVNYFYVYDNGDAVNAPVELLKDRPLTIVHTKQMLNVYHGNTKVATEQRSSNIFLRNFSDKKYFSGLSLASPDTARKFPVLRGPSHPLLTHARVRTSSLNAKVLFAATDPQGDDNGTSGTYRYPLSHHFKRGILDIVKAAFRYDNNNLYCTLTFSGLYDPGWHPEYGFQLTLAAIAINTGNGHQRVVGLNSAYTLDRARAFDRMIVVGGGVRVLDGNGTVLCEYIPGEQDVRDPIGNVRTNTIEFALPLEYLGIPDKRWTITVLIGGQDDHGGAGIGEFRSVQRESSEWLGGGKKNDSDSNIYDILFIN